MVRCCRFDESWSLDGSPIDVDAFLADVEHDQRIVTLVRTMRHAIRDGGTIRNTFNACAMRATLSLTITLVPTTYNGGN